MATHYYLFDMDGTLFFTDELNNESYNLALIENNFNPICGEKRITREIVKNFYPEINEQEMAELINQKQNYFIKNICRVQKNDFLFDMLSRIKKSNCILWTSAEKKRVDSMIKEFDLQRFFGRVIFSTKKHISKEIDHICTEFICTRDQLCAFENDVLVAKELKEGNVGCFLFIRP